MDGDVAPRGVARCPLPPGALLAAHARDGVYTDCFATAVAGAVSLAAYLDAFYTTPLFRLERLVLRAAFGIAATDADLRRLADGAAERFAAWRVEARTDEQLLLADIRGRTRSWLMVAPPAGADRDATRLYFGSAVLPADGEAGRGGNLLLALHRRYSVLLLGAARRRLRRGGARRRPARP